MMMKPLAAGLLSVAALTTPAMAQVIVVEPGVMGYSYPNTAYMPGGYGYRVMPGPGYYYGYGGSPGPRVGAFATAPWVDTSYGYVGPY